MSKKSRSEGLIHSKHHKSQTNVSPNPFIQKVIPL